MGDFGKEKKVGRLTKGSGGGHLLGHLLRLDVDPIGLENGQL